jgi:hypothetical protein
LRKPSSEPDKTSQQSLQNHQILTKTASRSKDFAYDNQRGLFLPANIGFDPETGEDRHGRPQHINIQSISEYLKDDICAHDRFLLPESNKADNQPLFGFQRLIMREFAKRDFLWLQMMRGGSKTYTLARAVLNYCLANPGMPAILTGPSFRQALLMFDEIVKMIELNDRNENGPFKLKGEIVGEIKRNTMESLIKFRNGSLIKAVPMGDGSKIRGLRGGLLIVDEFYLISEEMYESHISPFAMVKQGGRDSKIVVCTTSWFQDTFAYRRLLQVASEVKSGNPAYGILDFNLEDLIDCKFPLSKNVWKDMQRHSNPLTFAMTFFNVWPTSISRWYEQPSIDAALSARHGVRIELERPKDEAAEYTMIVDLASSSEKGDFTEILVSKYVDGAQRFVYGVKGRGWGPHRRAWEAHQVREKFQARWMIYDAHGAIGKDFRQTMSEDTLVVDGSVKSVSPCIHWNEQSRRGERIMIPVNPREDKVILALTGVRNGEVEGEDGMGNLLHEKCKNLLWAGKILGPSSVEEMDEVTAQKTQYLGSEQEALDVVREAFYQLANISLAKDAQGNQKITKSGQQVFKSKYGVARDDGAYCIVYSTIGLLLAEQAADSRPRPRSTPMTNNQTLKGTAQGMASTQRLTFAKPEAV